MKRTRRRKLQVSEALESRVLLAAEPVRVRQIAWIPDADEPALNRLDLQTEAWLPTVVMQSAAGPADYFDVDQNGLCVAFGRDVYLYSPDGQSRTLLLSADGPVDGVFLDGDLVIVSQNSLSGTFVYSVNRQTGGLIQKYTSLARLLHGDLSVSENRLLGRNTGFIPSDNTWISYGDDGRFTGSGDSPYHGNFPAASRTWVVPDGRSTIDDAGYLYTADTLNIRSQIGMSVTDVEFLGDVPIVASWQTLVAFDQAFRETGRVLLDYTPDEIFVGSSSVLTLTVDAADVHGYRVRSVPLSQLNPAVPGAPVNPAGRALDFFPDSVFEAQDGTVLIHSWSLQSLLRWNPMTQNWTTTIPLVGFPQAIDYSASSNQLYLAYAGGVINRIDLNAATPQETFFARMPGKGWNVVATGSFVLGVSNVAPDFRWYHTTFALDGTQVTSEPAYGALDGSVWSDAQQQVMTASSFSNQVVTQQIDGSGLAWPDVAPGHFGETQYHSGYASTSIASPLRVSPEGDIIVLGNGRILDAHTFVMRQESVVTDGGAVWFDQQLFTNSSLPDGIRILASDRTTFAPRKQWDFFPRNSDLVALLPLNSGRLLIMSRDLAGVPAFDFLEADLTNSDPQTGFTLSQSEVTVTEDGDSSQLTVVLNSQPAGTVVLQVVSSRSLEAVTDQSRLTFGPDNWNLPQTIRVTGVNDDAADEDQIGYLTISVVPELSQSFRNAQPQTLVIHNLDNDGRYAGVLPTVRTGDITWFFRRSSARIDRFDSSQGQWLSPIFPEILPAHPDAGWVDDDGIYLAFGNTLMMFDLLGRNSRSLQISSREIAGIHTHGDLLFVIDQEFNRAMISSLRKSDGTVLSQKLASSQRLAGSSISTAARRIFVRDLQSSSTELIYVSYTDTGVFTTSGQTFTGSVHPFSVNTWTFPSGDRVINDAGTVFSAGSLNYVASLPGVLPAFADLDFAGPDNVVAVSGKFLLGYARDYRLLGTLLLPETPLQVVTSDSSVYVMVSDASVSQGLRVLEYPLASINLTAPGVLIDPHGLAYTPDQVAVTNSGMVLLLKKSLNSIFRWDPATGSYGPTIPLSSEPRNMAYSPAANAIFVSFESGEIRRISLNDATLTEQPFATLAKTVSLAATGNYLWGSTASRHFTLRMDGTFADARDRQSFAPLALWSEVNQRVYLVDQNSTSNRLVSEQVNASGSAWPGINPGGLGQLTGVGLPNSFLTRGPITVSPDGRFLVSGSGTIFDATQMTRLPWALSGTFESGVWSGSRLLTAREVPSQGVTAVQLWNNTTFELLETRHFSGTAPILQTLADGQVVLIVQSSTGIPEFHVLSSGLSLQHQKPGLVVSQTHADTVVSEDGDTDEIFVSLSQPPASNVVVNLSSSRIDYITSVSDTLTFTPDNWAVPQVVTLMPGNPGGTNSFPGAALTLAVRPAASDPAFAGADRQVVFVTLLDNDNSASGFLPALKWNDVVWFVRRSSGRVERFDMMANRWLAPIELPGNAGAASAAAVDADGLYVAFGRTVYRYAHDGSSRSHVISVSQPGGVFPDDDLILIGGTVAVRKSSPLVAVLDHRISPEDPVLGLPDQNLLVASDTNTLRWVTYSEEGVLGRIDFSPSTGIPAPSSQLWASPSGELVINALGQGYSPKSFQQTGFLGSSVTDVDFGSNGMIAAVSENRLRAFSAELLPTGSVTLDHAPEEIFVYPGSHSIFTFQISPVWPRGIQQQRVDLSQLKPDEPAAPISPAGLAFTPFSVDLTSDGTLLLFSRDLSSIFRWNLVSQSWLPTIPLAGAPRYVAWMASLNAVFVADATGLLSRIDLSGADLTAKAVRMLLSNPVELEAVGDFLLVKDSAVRRGSFTTYRPDGRVVDAADNQSIAFHYVWNDAAQKVFYVDEANSQRSLRSLEIEGRGDVYPGVGSGEFGNFRFRSVNLTSNAVPLFVSPAGDQLVLGSGHIMNPSTLEPTGFVPGGDVRGAAWLQGRLLTIQPGGQDTILNRWSINSAGGLTVGGNRLISGTPQWLFTTEDRVVVVSRDSQLRPVLTVLDDSFRDVPSTPVIIPALSRDYRTPTPSFTWISHPEAVSYQLVIQNSSGQKIQELSTSTASATLSVPLSNGTWRALVRARLADGTDSVWSGAYLFRVDTLRLLGPVTVSTAQTPFVSWEGHSDASSYEIWINHLDTKSVAYRKSGLLIRNWTVPESLPVGQYAVWVRSADAAGRLSSWSDRRTFEIVHPPVAISDGAGFQSDPTPQLRWSALAGVTSWELIVQRTDNRQTALRVTGWTSTSYEVSRPLLPGAWTVWVRGWMNGRAVTLWGRGTQLVVTSPPQVSFSAGRIAWPVVPEAAAYDLRVVSLLRNTTVFAKSDVQTNVVPLDSVIVPGTYRVEARSVYAGGAVSELRSTTFEVFHDPVVIQPLPAGTVDQTPVIQWKSVTGAGSFEVVVRRISDAALLFSQAGIRGTQFRVPTPLPNGPATVWVRAVFSDGTRTAWGAGRTVAIGMAPVLTRTGNQLSWSTVSDATHYEVWVNFVAPGQSAATALVRADLVPGTALNLPSAPAGTRRAWVRAVRAEGGQLYRGLWSEMLEFVHP